MRLKELITRSGGMITAIALLGSMVVMAEAAMLPTIFTCPLCDDPVTALTPQSTYSANTYQQYFSVGNISNLTNATVVYEDNHDLLVAVYNNEMICQTCLENKVAEYKAANAPHPITSPGTSSTPVTLTAAASTFNVTVPTSIPLVVGADSKVTSPSDVKIINNSAGPVKVTAIAMNDGAWTMADYNGGDRSNLAAEKVGSNKLGLSLTAGGNTAASSKDGSQSPAIDSTKWRIAGKNTENNELPITVDAIASAVFTKIENAVTAANVVFTVAWDK